MTSWRTQYLQPMPQTYSSTCVAHLRKGLYLSSNVRNLGVIPPSQALHPVIFAFTPPPSTLAGLWQQHSHLPVIPFGGHIEIFFPKVIFLKNRSHNLLVHLFNNFWLLLNTFFVPDSENYNNKKGDKKARLTEMKQNVRVCEIHDASMCVCI